MANRGSRFASWISSASAARAAWLIVLATYVTFRAMGVEDPILGQAFMLLTGAWVGTLTLAQGRKQQQVEEKVEQLEHGAEASERRADAIEKRAEDKDGGDG